MKRKIVLIDDQETQRRLLREFLGLSGHEIIGEREVFRKIQELSMNKRKTMKEVAEAIIITDKIRKTSTK
jgi:response regulator NasT